VQAAAIKEALAKLEQRLSENDDSAIRLQQQQQLKV
jgi:hypothetical protein